MQNNKFTQVDVSGTQNDEQYKMYPALHDFS
jgi:hypothetical protein